MGERKLSTGRDGVGGHAGVGGSEADALWDVTGEEMVPDGEAGRERAAGKLARSEQADLRCNFFGLDGN